ncbi:MAG TPA: DUF4286 family protein [Parafilimonas sp.]|nr:DUF4286 family protein [Parafilimonas sp.]
MFIYNVTSKINWPIHEAWMEWMTNEYIPAIMATHCFTDFQLLKLHEQDDAEGPTYVAQYFAASKSQYNRYIELFAPKFEQDGIAKWGNNFMAFASLLEVVK